MDDRRFDRLAKALSGATGSRREALKLFIGGGAAVAGLGILGDEETAAADRDRNRRRRRTVLFR